MIRSLLLVLITAVLTSIGWMVWNGKEVRITPANPDPVHDAEFEPAAERTLDRGDTLRLDPDADPPTMAAPSVEIGPSGLAVPVAGVAPEDLVDTFTQARAGGARRHDAIDIMAEKGRRVVSASSGIVEKIYFSKGGGGKSVYVRSKDKRWIYYYAHLDRYARGLKEGQRVKRGTPLGRVGSSGNASKRAPHLHFAIHRMEPEEGWWEGRPVNPYPLLAGRASTG
ncbi:M23 family metallopeptidase [Sphingomicrobium lutaoense]|uniref:Murein DD-endopeptidase MepM/ murein hydrolase activator NlpD n=1 Tax=Sphingomicrobium lutaoense TaxID=515949 RepID=A0A839YZY5_9SPHN|nr:M23 family metallopeptidase [Sphingomicrobium lutaoense]MBB3763888.1 murein DD-endopeptidase MepM/ murein hydrolase activator NlpD [Sphingomicrobium lutaoense]